MFKISTNIDSIEKIDKHLKLVKKMSTMKTDTKFQNYIKEKCWSTLISIMDSKLAGGTSNDEEIELYRSSNHIEDTKDGFIIYNNAKIPADKYNILPFDTSGYPEGQFSIALAFEYGVGVTGLNPYGTENGYSYKGNGWYLPKNVYGSSGIKTMGYTGFEIYRFTAIEIETQLPKWTNDYFRSDINE
jgi:hypothetical protein